MIFTQFHRHVEAITGLHSQKQERLQMRSRSSGIEPD